jgi:hypothetical protein
LKVFIEVDTSSPEDLAALKRLLPDKPAAEPPASEPAPKAKPALKAVVERGKAMTKVSKDLGNAVGDGRAKLTPSEKARVAAKAMWEKRRAADAGKPQAPKAKPQPKAKAKPKAPPPIERREPDFSRAKEEPLEAYAESPGAAMLLAREPQPYPDGERAARGDLHSASPRGGRP